MTVSFRHPARIAFSVASFFRYMRPQRQQYFIQLRLKPRLDLGVCQRCGVFSEVPRFICSFPPSDVLFWSGSPPTHILDYT